MGDLPAPLVPIISVLAGAGGIAWGLSQGEQGDGLVFVSALAIVVGVLIAWYMLKHPQDFNPPE